jgi:hypothetical protein
MTRYALFAIIAMFAVALILGVTKLVNTPEPAGRHKRPSVKARLKGRHITYNEGYAAATDLEDAEAEREFFAAMLAEEQAAEAAEEAAAAAVPEVVHDEEAGLPPPPAPRLPVGAAGAVAAPAANVPAGAAPCPVCGGDDHSTPAGAPGPESNAEAVPAEPETPAAIAGPEDPRDVLTDEAEADAWVGELDDGDGADGGQHDASTEDARPLPGQDGPAPGELPAEPAAGEAPEWPHLADGQFWATGSFELAIEAGDAP